MDCPYKWTDGVASSYENDDGEFQDEDVPAAIRRLVDPTGTESHRLRTLDDSRFGMGLSVPVGSTRRRIAAGISSSWNSPSSFS